VKPVGVVAHRFLLKQIEMKKILLLIIVAMASSMYLSACENEKVVQLDARLDDVRMEKTDWNAPLIGVTPTNGETGAISKAYIDAVIRAGGVPVVIAADTSATYLNDIVSRIDGLLLTGGGDIEPSYFGEQPDEHLGEVDNVRDVLELCLARLAMRRNLPIFGICRGEQVLNVAFGGTLYQDLPSQHSGEVRHHRLTTGERATHLVNISKNAKLYSVLGVDTLWVNSSHHQAVKKIADGATLGAVSADGVVEAIDFYPLHRAFGVQWHPEAYDGENDKMNRLFDFFIGEAQLYKHACAVHAKVLSVDTHTDAPLEFEEGAELGCRSNNRVNIPKMREGMLDSQFLAAYVGSDIELMKDGKDVSIPRVLNQASYDECHERVLKLIADTYAQVKKYSDECGIALTAEDAQRLKDEGKKAFFIGVENGIGLGYDLGRLKQLKDLGVKYLTLCHTYDNQICNSSTHTSGALKGLTSFGEKVVKEMNRLGMIIDLSHTSVGTFWDVMKLSDKPVVCSHSGARALCDNDRNITDAQLRALAKNGGVIQTVAYDPFLRTDGKSTIEDFIHHLDYMVKVAGVDHVGIGTDFDGGGGVPGLQSDSDMLNITMRLIELGYSDEDLAKIWGGNFFRVMKAVEN